MAKTFPQFTQEAIQRGLIGFLTRGSKSKSPPKPKTAPRHWNSITQLKRGDRPKSSNYGPLQPVGIDPDDAGPDGPRRQKLRDINDRIQKKRDSLRYPK